MTSRIVHPSARPVREVVRARFDDLGRDGSAVELHGPTGILETASSGEVLDVLEAVDRATTAGSWAAGYVAYEAASGLGSQLSTRAPASGAPFAEQPLVWFALFDGARPVQHLRDGRDDDGALGAAGDERASWKVDASPDDHAAAVEMVRAHIAAGDTYECNLTTRFRATIAGDPFELYRRLALAQDGAYSAFLDTGRFVVASASPELFFEWAGDVVTTRPMKGTAARGRSPEQDAAAASGLVASPKERAENVMIVDLMRNDLGRLARWGTVEVPELLRLERYPTLWQLTSTVTARPRSGTSLVDIFVALFPSGSVTGAPKRRTMQIIAGIEPGSRGVYCGAIGWVAPPGERVRARFSVAIRTVVVDRRDARAVYGSGGAITWDSNPAQEYRELLTKAAVLAGTRPIVGDH